MPRRGLIVVAALVAVFLFAVSSASRAQEFGDYGEGHAEWHNFYNTGENGGPLMRPHQPSVKCCEGDCRPTKAMRRNDRWYAWVDRGWVLVPLDRIKENIRTPNGTAHVCAARRFGGSNPEIFCFVEPNIEG
jgi:hypothetical protein